MQKIANAGNVSVKLLKNVKKLMDLLIFFIEKCAEL
jgi:hypothetical protein